MKPYQVKFWNEDGSEGFWEFDTIQQAMELYDSLDGLAEIHQYNEDRHCYEAIIYPEFEY